MDIRRMPVAGEGRQIGRRGEWALAPSAEQQEFFGLSPEFGEKEERQMEKQPMEQQQKQKQAPEGSRY